MTTPSERELQGKRLEAQAEALHVRVRELVEALSISNTIQARLGGLDERQLKLEANVVKRNEMDTKVAAVETNARLERRKYVRRLGIAIGVIALLVAGIVVVGILVVHRFDDDKNKLTAANTRLDDQDKKQQIQQDDLLNIQVASCLSGNQARIALRAYLENERKAEVLSSDNPLAKKTRLDSIDTILKLYPEPRKTCDPKELAKEHPAPRPSN